jgi:hypothetical protein
MANELNIALSTGLTVSVQPYAAGAASGSPISLSEVSTSGFYTGNMTGSAGTYQLVFLSGGATVGTGQIVWSGSAEVPVSTLSSSDIPTASENASAVWGAATREITGGTVDTLVNAPSVPSASAIADEVRLELAPELSNLDAPVSGATAPDAASVATAVRSELSVELAHLDADISSRAVAGDIPTSDITDIKAKTDLLNTDRLAQCSTVSTTGAQIAAALS